MLERSILPWKIVNNQEEQFNTWYVNSIHFRKETTDHGCTLDIKKTPGFLSAIHTQMLTVAKKINNTQAPKLRTNYISTAQPYFSK